MQICPYSLQINDRYSFAKIFFQKHSRNPAPSEGAAFCGETLPCPNRREYSVPLRRLSLVLRSVCEFQDPVSGRKFNSSGRVPLLQTLRLRALHGGTGAGYIHANAKHLYGAMADEWPRCRGQF